jgi:hypothetical protein
LSFSLETLYDTKLSKLDAEVRAECCGNGAVIWSNVCANIHNPTVLLIKKFKTAQIGADFWAVLQASVFSIANES